MHANMGYIEGAPLKLTPNWDDLGWGGIPREGEGGTKIG
jgi:hypothetical protein